MADNENVAVLKMPKETRANFENSLKQLQGVKGAIEKLSKIGMDMSFLNDTIETTEEISKIMLKEFD